MRHALTKASFLAALRERLDVRAAAAAAGVHRSTVYRWRETDPQFAADWAALVEQVYQAHLQRSKAILAARQAEQAQRQQAANARAAKRR